MQNQTRTGLPVFDLMFALQDAMLRPLAAVAAGSGARSTALVLHRGGGGSGTAQKGHVIPLAEETLSIEARKVNGATTRVHRYVIETPVERRVALQDERVVVERRRPAAVDADAAAAQDTLTERTVEATETHEVPVVWKGVRVREEMVLRLERSERTETVRETVRRDEVAIEQPSRAAAVPQREPTGGAAPAETEAKASGNRAGAQAAITG